MGDPQCRQALLLNQIADLSYQVNLTIRIQQVRPLVDIDDPANQQRVPLPDLSWRTWLDQMDVRPDQNVEYLPSGDALAPVLAGRTEDGSLAVVTSLWMPADDAFNYVFRLDGESWSISQVDDSEVHLIISKLKSALKLAKEKSEAKAEVFTLKEFSAKGMFARKRINGRNFSYEFGRLSREVQDQIDAAIAQVLLQQKS